MKTEKRKASVAVVGLGACGLVALKNLREAGFDAVGFDRNNYVGGLWQYTEDPKKTSVLKSTVANLSRELGCYTDFPFSEKIGDFPTATQTALYLNDYADHFNLRPYVRLSASILRVFRRDNTWCLEVVENDDKSSQLLSFDKVVICMGLQVQRPKMPPIEGLETFSGTAIHSNAYKRPEDFDGKRVVVVGLGNTGPDTAVDLIGHASNIWLSHRRGNAIFPRRNRKGKPGDHILSLRLTKFGGVFNRMFPNFSQRMSLLGMKRLQNQAFDIKPEWNLEPIPFPIRKITTMNDDLIPSLHEEKLSLKPGLQSIAENVLSFSDGSKLNKIDAIIFCTGFRSDFSYMDPAIDPTRNSRKDWHDLPGADGRPLPRLYQGIFSLDFPDSLAFLGTSPLTPQACLNYDISSSAVAQVWVGKSTLPSREEMDAHVDAQHEVVCNIARTGGLANTNLRNNWQWFEWCDEAAGLGLVKRVGYGLEGWKFWFRDRKLCKLVMDGLMSPHLFRLFDEGKRKPWDQARNALEAANANV